MLKEFDELKKYIKDKKGLELAKRFRKKLKKSEDYANKLDNYFADTINGTEPERSKEYNGL